MLILKVENWTYIIVTHNYCSLQNQEMYHSYLFFLIQLFVFPGVSSCLFLIFFGFIIVLVFINLYI